MGRLSPAKAEGVDTASPRICPRDILEELPNVCHSEQQAVELAPGDSFAHYYLGRVQLDVGSYESAFQELDRSGIAWPADSQFLIEAASGYFALGRREKAREIVDGQNGNSGVILIPRNSGRPADIQSWNVDVQRQIAKNLEASVAYVGSKGTHLPALNIIPNQVNPTYLALGSELTMNVSCLTAVPMTCPSSVAAGVKVPYAGFTGDINQALRPFPQYGDFNQEDDSFTPDRTGNSTYHSMQAQVNKRFAEGLSFLVSYTVSKNITDADSQGPGVQGFIGANAWIGENSYNRRAEKAVSSLDTPQSLVASFFYELPMGHGKTLLNKGGVTDRIVGGWSVSGILGYQSGQPTEVYAPCTGTAGAVLFGGCEFTGSARVNVIPGVKQTNGRDLNPLTTPFFNSDAFAPAAPFTFGNENRTLASARTFGARNESITIGKKTRIGERGVIDFRAEFFDIFNRHIYQQPGGSGGFATQLGTPFAPANTPTCQQAFACGFGAITNATGPRTIQLGLKIEY